MWGKQCVGNKFPSLRSQVRCPPSIPLLNEKGDRDDSKLAQEHPTEDKSSEERTSDPPLGTTKPVQEKVGPGEPAKRTKDEDGTEKEATQETISGDSDGQDRAEKEIESAVEKTIQESEIGAKSGEKPVLESDLELKEDEDGPKPMHKPVQDTENPKVDGQDKAEEEIESAEEKPIQETEVVAKSGEKPVLESDLELKEDEDGPKPMHQPVQDTENPKVDGQDKAEEEIESAVEKPIQESEVAAKSGERPVLESDLELKEDEDGPKPMHQPVQDTENPKVDGQDKAEEEIESAVEKPIQESEIAAKSGEKPVQESEDVGKKPKLLDPVQETENPTVSSTVFDSMPQPVQDTENPKGDGQDKAEEEIESSVEKPIQESEVSAKSGEKPVQESDLESKEGEDGPKPLDPVQETENPAVGSTTKSELENTSVEDSGKQGGMADPKMPGPVQETKNPDEGSTEKRELEDKSVEESGKQGNGGESDSQRNVAGSMPSDSKMAEPIQESEDSVGAKNETEHKTTGAQGGHQVVDDKQNGDLPRDVPVQNSAAQHQAIFEIPLDWRINFGSIFLDSDRVLKYYVISLKKCFEEKIGNRAFVPTKG